MDSGGCSGSLSEFLAENGGVDLRSVPIGLNLVGKCSARQGGSIEV